MKKQFTTLCLLAIGMIANAQTMDFQADPGIRVQEGTTRNAIFRNDSLYLYYGYNLWDGTNFTPVSGLAIATDAPNYNNFVLVNMNDYPLYHYTLMPDGITRRKYGKPMGQDHLVSESTTDWWTSTVDTTIRYYLHASDSSTFGVSTTVVDANDDVHIYYMGDMSPLGKNNVRHCMSTDGGDFFTYQTNDVCGDYAIGGQYSHLDPFALLMDDNSIRLFTINAHGTVVPQNATFPTKWVMHSFISTDHGMNFTQESTSMGDDTIVSYIDFIDTNIRSLHDPKAVQLPDGRVKVFMNGSSFDNNDSLHWDIYSVTQLPNISGVTEYQIETLNVFPNPTNDMIQIQLNGGNAKSIHVFDAIGQLVMIVDPNSKTVDFSQQPKGFYVMQVVTQSGQVITEKIFKQ